jgi:hypothetical protein
MARSGPRWTVGGADTGCGGALPARGERALGLIGAHRWGTTGRGYMGNSMGCSPGRGRQCGSRAMVVKNDGDLSSS